MKLLKLGNITIFVNITKIKQKYDNVIKKYNDIVDYISVGSANSLMATFIITFGMVISVIATNSYDIHEAQILAENARILTETENIKLVAAREKSEQDVIIQNIKSNSEEAIMKYKARAEEAKAAINPYILAAAHPVNVFIGTHENLDNSVYVLKTKTGITEIEISTIRVKGRKYTPEQRKLMTMAFHIGQEIGFPETIQSLLLQETRAGAIGDRIGDTNLPMGKRSYGVMQMKAGTARKVLKKYKELIPIYFPTRRTYKRLRDEEIIIKLIQDDEFNIRLAALNFVIHRKRSKTWSRAVVAYNTGQGKANKIAKPRKHVYYTHILKRLVNEVRPFNKEVGLTI